MLSWRAMVKRSFLAESGETFFRFYFWYLWYAHCLHLFTMVHWPDTNATVTCHHAMICHATEMKYSEVGSLSVPQEFNKMWGVQKGSFTKIWELTIPPTCSTEFLCFFVDAFENFRSWITESFCQRNSNAPAQVGTFEEEQLLGKSKWKRNLVWTRNRDGMWSYWQNMSRMHANTSICYTHLIVMSYSHAVFVYS